MKAKCAECMVVLGLLVASQSSPGQEAGKPAAGDAAKPTPCIIKSMTGTRDHERRGTSYLLMASDIVYAADGTSFSGKLSYRMSGRLSSDEPFSGRVLDDGSIRIDSRFQNQYASHDVRIVGSIDEGGRFSGMEGSYGVVKATVECRKPESGPGG